MIDLKIKLPENFLKAEVRSDYIVTTEVKKVWAIELDLLAELLRVCAKYNIKIFASGGTLLGAVRHKGFIPWDDDIDMMMFREDYIQLCKIADKEFKKPYFFQTEYNDPGSLRGHAQLRNSETTAILKYEFGMKGFNQGIFIDIFPLDNLVQDKELFRKQYRKVYKYYSAAFKISRFSTRYIQGETKGFKGIIKDTFFPITNFWLRKFKLEEKFYLKFEEACMMYNNVNTPMVSTLSLDFKNIHHFKYKTDFERIIYLPFEFIVIPVGSNYNHALTQRFGDYRKLVKGESLHGQILFDVDKSYYNYYEEESK